MSNIFRCVKPVVGYMTWTFQFVNNANEDYYDKPDLSWVFFHSDIANAVGFRVVRSHGLRRIGLNGSEN